MTTNDEALEALRTIAEIPLWGEPLTDFVHGDKDELAARDEYALKNAGYEPCVDAESSWLRFAVETAREVLGIGLPVENSSQAIIEPLQQPEIKP